MFAPQSISIIKNLRHYITLAPLVLYSFGILQLVYGILLFGTIHQGCRVGVKTGVGVGRSRPLCLESESELQSVKFCRLRLQPGVAGYQPLTDDDFGPAVICIVQRTLKHGKKRRVAVRR